MSKRQLEQLRQTLDSIVEDLCTREQVVDQEHEELKERLTELDARQSHLQSLQELLAEHKQSESQWSAQLEALIQSIDERTVQITHPVAKCLDKLDAMSWDSISQRITEQVESAVSKRLEQSFENRLAAFAKDVVGQFSESLNAKLVPTVEPPKLADMVREFERIQALSVDRLSDRLITGLQAAMSVQLAPLTDDMVDRLKALTERTASTVAGSTSAPEIVRELEKFETRSMASLTARLTSSIQSTVSNQLSAANEALLQRMAQELAQTISISAPRAAAMSHVDFADHPTGQLDSSAHSTALELELERVKAQLAETEALLAEAVTAETHADQENTHTLMARLSEIEADRESLKQQLAECHKQLAESVSALDSTVDSKADNEAGRSDDAEVASLKAQIEELKALLEVRSMVRSVDPTGEGSELREQLERASCEIIDLRSQNEELQERVSKLQVSTAPHGPMPHLGQEGWSWEERKRHLLQQLDAEEDASTPELANKRLEIEDVIKRTDAELNRRDREIAELRSLLEQQAAAREGMAVGAAAVAQLIESDELIQQEREKLRKIQQSWEEKLRQAEIDLSMERAKLSRERLQLESLKQEWAETHSEAPSTQDSSGNASPGGKANTDASKGRKWLSRLGLKDES